MKYLLPLALCIFLACNEEIENTNNSEQTSVDEVAVAPIVEEVAPVPVPVEVVKELTYEEVIQSNNIQEIKDFINNNSSHPKIEKLKKHLIDIEVDEIINDEKTGKMPTSQKIDFEISDFSNIEIKNSTGCELIVRYSGQDSKSISISNETSRKISIESGQYRIAASACGLNYAGHESLNGNYSSEFYVRSSRF
jgi:hypothetical protein